MIDVIPRTPFANAALKVRRLRHATKTVQYACRLYCAQHGIDLFQTAEAYTADVLSVCVETGADVLSSVSLAA